MNNEFQSPYEIGRPMFAQRLTVLLAVTVVANVSLARAHFLWIAPDRAANEKRVHVYFSETAEPDDPALLSRLTGLKLQQNSSGGKSHLLEPTRGKDSLVVIPEGGGSVESYSLTHKYGTLSRDGETFLLVYHARMYPATPTNRWSLPQADQQLPLELVPSMADGKLTVRVLWNGKPLPAAEVKADPAGKERIEGASDAAGAFTVSAGEPGTYAFRARHIEHVAGESGGKKYDRIRHYSTLVVTIVGDHGIQATARKVSINIKGPKRPRIVSTSAKTTFARDAARALPDLPFGITSFGAAIVDQKVYICAGHLGPAHEYDREGQSDRLLRLDLRSPQQWETIGTVPRRAGLAMVSFGDKVYRIGGFEARNKKGEPADMHSMPDFSHFDPTTGRWEDLAPMPKGRSSHDAVVVGSRLIVVGGWELRGTEPAVWHDTALQIDLSSAQPAWAELPKPPFRRRALALGECQGKVYALGGMQEHGGPTTTTYVLDLAAGKWSQGPKLPGEGLQGFGGCAITCAGRCYATTYSGKLCCLSNDNKAWQDAGQLTRSRFFHRLLCVDESSLIAVGGGNMEEGKDLSVEVVPVSVSR
jgi:hypothetical protein